MRRKAAAVPTAKIKLKEVYAIYHPDTGDLVRFLVQAVITRRVDDTGSPHDYETLVEGIIEEPGERHEEGKLEGKRKKYTYPANKLLGEFTEHAELVERQKAEKKAEAERKAEFARRLEELCRLLYALIGEPPPDDLNDYHNTIRIGYSTQIEIKKEAFLPLIGALRAKVPA